MGRTPLVSLRPPRHTAPRRGAAAARWAGAAPPHTRIRRGRWEILITDGFILHNCG